jgi:hypothetical protein
MEWWVTQSARISIYLHNTFFDRVTWKEFTAGGKSGLKGGGGMCTKRKMAGMLGLRLQSTSVGVDRSMDLTG